MSYFLDRLMFFSHEKEDFAGGHGVTSSENRAWEKAYRDRWAHDKIVRSTHGVNCTGSCSWKIYVKNGLITWETQQTDYPRTRPDLPNHEPRALMFAWMGPFIGALIRPVGGWIADKFGGALVTGIVSAVMIASAFGVAYYMQLAYGSATPQDYFVPFFLLFLVLFTATGIGNGSTFRTIANVFDKEQAGPVLGWTSAVAAYGAFIIPQVFGEQIQATTPEVALYGFAAFYAVCLVLNWWVYLRPGAKHKNP